MLLLLSPFFERHRVVLNKGTDGCMESTFVIPQDGYVTKYGIGMIAMQCRFLSPRAHFPYCTNGLCPLPCITACSSLEFSQKFLPARLIEPARF